MSFPYGQYPGENFSSPSTPLDAFPQWETLEREEQQSNPQQQQQDQQSQQDPAIQNQTHHQPPELHPQTGPLPPQQHYQTIRLEEPVPTVTSQQRSAHEDFPVRLHHVHRPERRRESPGERDSALPHIDTLSSSTSTAAGPVRQSPRSHQQQQQAHPYRRPSGTSASSNTRQQHVRFAGAQASASSSTMPSPSVPSPAMPSPASATGRLAGLGSTASSPLVTRDMSLPPSLSRPDPNTPKKRFIIRTDSNYDPESKVLTAMLELPGVKKADVRVILSTCYYNGVRQITVSGHTNPVFPMFSEGGLGSDLTIRERKFGEFTRTFPVPSDIKREDIDASMEDGILTLRIPCGMPASPDAENVLIR